MDVITKIIFQFMSLIKNLLETYGLDTSKLVEIMDQFKPEEDVVEPTE